MAEWMIIALWIYMVGFLLVGIGVSAKGHRHGDGDHVIMLTTLEVAGLWPLLIIALALYWAGWLLASFLDRRGTGTP